MPGCNHMTILKFKNAPAPVQNPKTHDEATQLVTYKAASQAAFAAMETGNFDRAREVLETLEDVYPEGAVSLKLELIDAYNLSI